MTKPDISKIAVGDKITVEVEVAESVPSTGWFKVKDTAGDVREVHTLHIRTHTPAPPKPLEVGDKVTIFNSAIKYPYVILALNDEAALI